MSETSGKSEWLKRHLETDRSYIPILPFNWGV